jgi:hypothetical protein
MKCGHPDDQAGFSLSFIEWNGVWIAAAFFGGSRARPGRERFLVIERKWFMATEGVFSTSFSLSLSLSLFIAHTATWAAFSATKISMNFDDTSVFSTRL